MMSKQKRNKKSSNNRIEPISCQLGKEQMFQQINKSFNLFDENIESYKPYYLQLPIGIQTRTYQFHKQRKNSQSFSQLFHQDQHPKDQIQKYNSHQFYHENDLMEPQQNSLDIIDQLLLPPQFTDVLSIQGLDQEKEINLQNHREQEIQLSLDLQPVNSMASDQKLSKKPEIRKKSRRAIMSAINSFHTFNRSLHIAMNFHSLLKKDNVTKMFSSILGVLTKQSKRMQNILKDEIKIINLNTDSNIKFECMNVQEQIRKYTNKDIFNTMAGQQEIMIKQQVFQQDQ